MAYMFLWPKHQAMILKQVNLVNGKSGTWQIKVEKGGRKRLVKD